MTPTQKRALEILADSSYDKPIGAREFAQKMWPDSLMHTKVKNTGNGACTGKGAWLCGGSYLAKLRIKNLVSYNIFKNGYYLKLK